MKQKLPENYLFRIVFPVLYGSVLYILILLVFENFEYVFKSFFSNEWLFTILLSYLSSELLHHLSVFIARKIVFTNKIAKYIAIQFIATIVAEFLLVFLAIHIYFTQVEGFSVYSTELTVFELFYLFSTLLYNLFIFSYLLLNQENTLQNNQEQEFKRKNDFLIQAIQNEIDPIVFYTIMESLLIYINKNEEIANDIINRLSTLYKYRLKNKFNEIIPVNDEKEALVNLVQLFNYVYSDSIEFKFAEIPPGNQYLIIPNWLQKIVLTVIRSNILTPIERFKISIGLNENSLVLKHSWRERLLVSEKVEIDRISGDFEFYTDRKIELIHEGDEVTLIIPLFQEST